MDFQLDLQNAPSCRADTDNFDIGLPHASKERKGLLDQVRSLLCSAFLLSGQNLAAAELESYTPGTSSPGKDLQAWKALTFFIIVNHLTSYLEDPGGVDPREAMGSTGVFELPANFSRRLWRDIYPKNGSGQPLWGYNFPLEYNWNWQVALALNGSTATGLGGK